MLIENQTGRCYGEVTTHKTSDSLTGQSLGSASNKMFTMSTTYVKHHETPHGCLVVSLQTMMTLHVAVDESVKPVVTCGRLLHATVHLRSKKPQQLDINTEKRLHCGHETLNLLLVLHLYAPIEPH